MALLFRNVRPAKLSATPPLRSGGSVSVYIHIYMYIAICIYMYICEQMGKRGGVLISPCVFLFFSLIFVDLSCPFIPRVSSKIFLEHPFPVLIAEIVTAVPLASPLCFSLFFSPPSSSSVIRQADGFWWDVSWDWCRWHIRIEDLTHLCQQGAENVFVPTGKACDQPACNNSRLSLLSRVFIAAGWVEGTAFCST